MIGIQSWVSRTFAETFCSRSLREAGFASLNARGPAWFAPADPTGPDAEAATAALAGLPPDQREAIVAHLWGGLTFDEVADLTGTSAATAYRRYAAGLTALRTALRVPCPAPSRPATPR